MKINAIHNIFVSVICNAMNELMLINQGPPKEDEIMNYFELKLKEVVELSSVGIDR